MGQGAHLTIANHSKHALRLGRHSSYQMNNWSFPDTIEAGSEATVYTEFDQSAWFTTENDDSGDAEYSLEGSDRKLLLEARKRDKFEIWAIVDGVRNNLGWLHDGQMRCEIYGGKDGIFCPAGHNWQSNLHDETLVRILSMPGTHDSGSFAKKSTSLSEIAIRLANPAFTIAGWIFDWFQSGGATCQSLSIKDQLQNGVRFLDIRLTRIEEELYIQHGNKPVIAVTYDYTFDQVLRDIDTFLSENDKEFVVISVKNEMGNDFSDLWERKYASRLNNLSKPYITTKGLEQNKMSDLSKLTVGHVRKQILVLSRADKIPGMPLGIADNAVCQKEKEFWVQDRYELKSDQISEKQQVISNFLNETASDAGKNLALNFTSMIGGGTIPNPKEAAEHINGWMKNELLKNNRKARTGIMVMDFPDPELMQAIYTRNF